MRAYTIKINIFVVNTYDYGIIYGIGDFMNNSKKLQDDAAKHRGFVSSAEQAWLEESDYERLQSIINTTSKQIAENMIKAFNTFDIGRSCPHKETVKKYVLTSHYYVCKACGEEV